MESPNLIVVKLFLGLGIFRTAVGSNSIADRSSIFDKNNLG